MEKAPAHRNHSNRRLGSTTLQSKKIFSYQQVNRSLRGQNRIPCDSLTAAGARSTHVHKGRHRSGAAQAEAPLRRAATPRNGNRCHDSGLFSPCYSLRPTEHCPPQSGTRQITPRPSRRPRTEAPAPADSPYRASPPIALPGKSGCRSLISPPSTPLGCQRTFSVSTRGQIHRHCL